MNRLNFCFIYKQYKVYLNLFVLFKNILSKNKNNYYFKRINFLPNILNFEKLIITY